MRLAAALLALFLALLPASPSGAEGVAYLVRVPSAGLYERPNAAEPFTTLFRDQVVTVLQRRGEWFLIITEEGEEGWMRETTVAAIPSGEDEEESQISEASPDEIPVTVLYDFIVGPKQVNIRREPSVSSPLAGSARPGEVFTIVATEGEWYQVSRESGVVGWMHRNLGKKQESTNLPLLLRDLIEGKLAYFDQFKNEIPHFRRQGWFPSFFLRSPGEDIRVTDLPSSGKEVDVHLSYARRDIEHRVVITEAGTFSLPAANRTFFADVLLSVLELSEEIERARLHLWFAVLEKDGSMSWESKGRLVLTAAAAGGILRQGDFASAVWSALEANSLPPSLAGPEGLP